jgi:hypothetical protein
VAARTFGARARPLFIEAFYDACEALLTDDEDVFAPDASMIKDLLLDVFPESWIIH